MKAYRCDICCNFCDDVLSLHGLSIPRTHEHYAHLVNGVADCCPDCYEKIMQFVYDNMANKLTIPVRNPALDL